MKNILEEVVKFHLPVISAVFLQTRAVQNNCNLLVTISSRSLQHILHFDFLSEIITHLVCIYKMIMPPTYHVCHVLLYRIEDMFPVNDRIT